MVDLAARHARLTRFLEPYGMTPDGLLSHVEEAFGPPLLLVATGSVIEGLGNERSDIDLDVIVEGERVTQLPIMTYAGGARIDVLYYPAQDITGRLRLLRETSWPPSGLLPRGTWTRYRQAMIALTRFAAGLPLHYRDGWDAWLAALQEPWLTAWAVRWWTVEAVRRRTAARWLFPAKPLLACQRYCDALFAAFQACAAEAGWLRSSSKWLPGILRLLDSGDLAVIREALQGAASPLHPARYQEWCEAQLDRLIPNAPLPTGLTAQLWYAPGVKAWPLGRRVLVTRWEMRGMELPADALTTRTDEIPVWQGSIEEGPTGPLAQLFVEDMVWLSLAARTEA